MVDINKIIDKQINPVDKILGKEKKKTLRSGPEKAIAGKICWNCGKKFVEGDDWYYYYHGDQDDRVCKECAKKLNHNDTAYAGLNVYKTNTW